jgi:DNA repair exonuclease SbcCD ATPase subunit
MRDYHRRWRGRSKRRSDEENGIELPRWDEFLPTTTTTTTATATTTTTTTTTAPPSTRSTTSATTSTLRPSLPATTQPQNMAYNIAADELHRRQHLQQLHEEHFRQRTLLQTERENRQAQEVMTRQQETETNLRLQEVRIADGFRELNERLEEHEAEKLREEQRRVQQQQQREQNLEQLEKAILDQQAASAKRVSGVFEAAIVDLRKKVEERQVALEDMVREQDEERNLQRSINRLINPLLDRLEVYEGGVEQEVRRLQDQVERERYQEIDVELAVQQEEEEEEPAEQLFPCSPHGKKNFNAISFSRWCKFIIETHFFRSTIH